MTWKYARNVSTIFVMGLVFVLCSTPPVWCQTTSGTILGSVKDNSGAVVPGVTITIKNVDTGFTRTLVTDDTGGYRAPNLPLGPYEVSAELSGFKSISKSGIHLTVGREAVVDFDLQIGEVSERVTVTGEAQLVSTTSATMQELVDQKKIRDLPLNGRDYLQLTTLQPGVLIMRQQRTDIAPQTGTGLNISISGGRPTQNNFRVDGVSVNDHANSSPGATTGSNLGVEALREFSVMTNLYSAEFGRSAGGVINAVTRSGTNQLHGSVFYFHRNDDMDARNFFTPGKLPEFRRHQFGVAAGGPVIKDRTFFFANYEGLREQLGQTSISTVLTADARQGNLTAGKVNVDPAIKPYLDLYPLPNGLIFGNSGQFISAPNRLTHENFLVTRGDHRFSEKASISGSYTYDRALVQQPEPLLIDANTSPSRRHYVTTEFTYVFTPRLINSARFGFNRSNLFSGLYTPIVGKVADAALGFLPGHGSGVIFVIGLTAFPGVTGPTDQESYDFNSYQGYDNASYVFGRHTLKFGANVEVIQDHINSAQANNGEFNFGTIQDFLVNKPDVFTAQLPSSDTVRNFRQRVWGVYMQDDLRVVPTLTLNLGLRWEMATDPTERDGKTAAILHLLDAKTTVGRFFETPKKNFAPRVGFAWDPFGTGKTSIRGGFGIFYDLPLVNLLTIPGLRIPPFFRRVSASGLAQGDFPRNAFTALVTRGTGKPDADSLEFNASPAYRMQYNLNIQREVFRNTVLTVGYVGGRGVHMTRLGEDENLATPTIRSDGRIFFPAGQSKPNVNFGRIRFWHWDANSFYNSFQLGGIRRWTQGLQLQGSYTFAKSVDDFSATFSSSHYRNSVANPYPNFRNIGRGLSDYDVRQSVVINGTWDIPGKVEGPLGAIVNGWQLGGIFTGNTGLPFSVTMGGDPARTLTLRRGTRSGQRPDQGTTSNPVTQNPNQWFDPRAFVFPERGVLGNVGRNTMIGPGVKNLDFTLVKDNPIPRVSEEFRIQFRVELFNAPNHTNFDLPELTDAFDAGGKVIENAGRLTRTVTTARQIQLGLKIIF